MTERFVLYISFNNGTRKQHWYESGFLYLSFKRILFCLPRIYNSIDFGSILFFCSSQILLFLVPVLPLTNFFGINRIWNDLTKKDFWRYQYETSRGSLIFLGFLFSIPWYDQFHLEMGFYRHWFLRSCWFSFKTKFHLKKIAELPWVIPA